MGSQQRIVVMIAMISGFISKGISRSRNMAITMISASGEIIGLGYTTKSLTLQACFVLGFLLQTSLAYRLDPNPQTNSIFATVPSSSISSSTSSQSSSQLSSKHGVKVFYQSGNILPDDDRWLLCKHQMRLSSRYYNSFFFFFYFVFLYFFDVIVL